MPGIDETIVTKAEMDALLGKIRQEDLLSSEEKKAIEGSIEEPIELSDEEYEKLLEEAEKPKEPLFLEPESSRKPTETPVEENLEDFSGDKEPAFQEESEPLQEDTAEIEKKGLIERLKAIIEEQKKGWTEEREILIEEKIKELSEEEKEEMRTWIERLKKDIREKEAINALEKEYLEASSEEESARIEKLIREKDQTITEKRRGNLEGWITWMKQKKERKKEDMLSAFTKNIEQAKEKIGYVDVDPREILENLTLSDIELLKEYYRGNITEENENLIKNKIDLAVTGENKEIVEQVKEIIEAHIKSEINKELIEQGFLNWGMAKKIIVNIALFAGVTAGISAFVGSGGLAIGLATGGVAVGRSISNWLFKKFGEKKVNKESVKQRKEIIENNFLSRENLAAIISNTIREKTSKQAQRKIEEYQEAESKIGIDGYKSFEDYGKALSGIKTEFYKNALNWVIVQEEYKDLDKENQQKIALFIAQSLSMHEESGAIENCEIAELKKKENSKVFNAIKNFSQLRSGKTGETLKATAGYAFLAAASSAALVAARYLTPQGRVAVGALSGFGFGLSIAEKGISKEQLKELGAISELLDDAEKLIEDIEFPDERINELTKNKIIVQARLREGILEADPAIKSRAEIFIFKVNELEFKQNQSFNALIEKMQENSEKILAQEKEDMENLEKQIGAQKSKKWIYALGGAVVGATSGFVGGELYDSKVDEQLKSLGLDKQELSDAQEALKAHTLSDFGEKLRTDDLAFLRDLNKSLEHMSGLEKQQIISGLIQDHKLNIEDLTLVKNLETSLHGFSPEVQGKILSSLAVDGLDKNDIAFIDNLKVELNGLGITETAQQAEVVSAVLEKELDAKSLGTFFNDLKNNLDKLPDIDKKEFITGMAGRGFLEEEINALTGVANLNEEFLNSDIGKISISKFAEQGFSMSENESLKEMSDLFESADETGREIINKYEDIGDAKMILKIFTPEFLTEHKEKFLEAIDQKNQGNDSQYEKMLSDLAREARGESALEIKHGDSIWSVAEKHLETNKDFQELIKNADKNTAEALKTYNIDRLKDAIVNDPEKFGLSKGVNVDKLTDKQLENIDWKKAIDETFPESKGLTENLSSEQVENIVKNNEELRHFFTEHPRAPGTSENYEHILRGKGSTGEETVIPQKETIETITDKPSFDEKIVETKETLGGEPFDIKKDEEIINEKISNLEKTEKHLVREINESTKTEGAKELAKINAIEAERLKTEVILHSYEDKGITPSIMRDIGIDPKDGLDSLEYKKLDFLSAHAEDGELHNAVEAVKLVKNTNVDYEFGLKHLDQFKAVQGDSGRIEATAHFLEGKADRADAGKIWGVPVNDENYEFKDGIHKIEIKKDFYYVIGVGKDGHIKIALDGPGKLNLWIKGFWHGRPDADLTYDNIKEIKGESKTLFDKWQDQIKRSRDNNFPINKE